MKHSLKIKGNFIGTGDLTICTVYQILWYMIYLLTAIGLSPGGSIHLHTNNI